MLELIFIPCPATGHIVSTVEFANRLLSHYPQFQATVLLLKSPWEPSSSSPQEEPKADVDPSSDHLTTNYSSRRLRYISLPEVEGLPPQHMVKESPEVYFCAFVDAQKPRVRAAVNSVAKNNHQSRLLIVLDMFCTSMIEVAIEFHIPFYLFYSSGAAFLGAFLDLPSLNIQFKEDGELNADHESAFQISTLANPLPCKLLPAPFIAKSGYKVFADQAKRFVEAKGIIVNTFEELEPYATNSLRTMSSNGLIPPVYTVGPILNLKGQAHGNLNEKHKDRIMKWLDDQPDSTVIFLCFGSQGAFSEPQLKEIATGLQETGIRFVWSLRKPPTKDEAETPGEYTDSELKELLPCNFMSLLEGDKRRGMVCGWAPQVEVLAHRAVGGFVSHCGWNSTLESLWFGVPIVTWPLYAEQHCNAFLLARELGLGVELRIDYRAKNGDMVSGDDIQQAVRFVMDPDNGVRKRIKEISEIGKQALLDGGSSFKAMDCLIRDMGINWRD